MSMIVNKIIELARDIELSGLCATRDMEISFSMEALAQIEKSTSFYRTEEKKGKPLPPGVYARVAGINIRLLK